MAQRYFDVNMRFDIQPPLRTSPGQRMSWPIVATFDVVSHLHPEVVRQHIRASQAKLNIWKGIDPGPEEYNVELSAALVPVDDGQNFQLRAVFPDVHIDSTGDFFLSVHGVFSMLGDPNVKDIMVHLDVRVDVEEGSPDIHKYSPAEIGFLRDNYQSLNMTAGEMEEAIKRRKAKEKGLVEGKDGESTARWDQDQITEMMYSNHLHSGRKEPQWEILGTVGNF
ncbi:predicted protein [Histoplasma mississippiense (nom. inval.)]|uniref:predicted protein n=1 Tax=Ajellomyces capsulatus (strain NAm1 / WU24) TaxID=2059318 RepID=UPI000157C161|nr:predicted protein [Histoplasma mississippiense (nom. inval.)]EDN07346.1 predicted protein [Histoplasma mississippiense (nom. inval.)]